MDIFLEFLAEKLQIFRRSYQYNFFLQNSNQMNSAFDSIAMYEIARMTMMTNDKIFQVRV